MLGLQSSTWERPTPAPTPRCAPHLRTTPCGAFPVELFAVGFSPNAGRVTDRYDKLSCRNSLGSRRIGDHEGLPPADGIRASGPGAHLRMHPLTRFETNTPLDCGWSISLRNGRFLRKSIANGHATAARRHQTESIGLMRVTQRFCIALISKRTTRAELHFACHWIETTDYSHPRASPIQGDQRDSKASREQREPLLFEEDYSQ